jgi:hypothetical protein
MHLTLIRSQYCPDCVIGSLAVDGRVKCFTLEDIERAEKIPGKTAIPRGLYKVALDYSVRFKRMMPHVLDVPGFEGIRIHPGNSSADTEGCILVGLTKANSSIGQSRIAFNRLYEVLEKAHNIGETIFIDISKKEENDLPEMRKGRQASGAMPEIGKPV